MIRRTFAVLLLAAWLLAAAFAVAAHLINPS